MLTWYKPAVEGVTPAYNTSVFANVVEPMVTCMSPAIELAAPGSWPAAKLGLVRPRPVAYRVITSPGLAGAKVPPVNNPGLPTKTPVLALTAAIGFWPEGACAK